MPPALISIKLGRDDSRGAELVLGNATMLLIIAGIAITGLGLLGTRQLLKLFGASETTLPYAKSYLQIILCGTIFQMIEFGMNSFIRAEGNPKTAMITMLIGTSLNLILDPIFIFVLKMEHCRSCSSNCALSGDSCRLGGEILPQDSTLKVKAVNFKLDPDLTRRILAIGSAPFISQFAASATSTVMNNSALKYGGDLAVSAMGNYPDHLITAADAGFGLNQGVQPIISF